jgi:hypothetical protein
LKETKIKMTSGSIDSWRNEPGRWSHRLIKNRRKEGSLRRSKSVDESTKEPLEKLQVIDEVQDEVHDDGYVEAETSPEPSIDENQVKNHIKKQLKNS